MNAKKHTSKSSVFTLVRRRPGLPTADLRSPISVSKGGFTLIELLTVIAIIMLLAGLILAGFNSTRDRARKLRAKRDIAQLKTALDAYYADYSAFPDITEEDSIEGNHYLTGTDLIQTLRGREGYNNPKKISYMDFHQDTTYFYDPWGHKYRVALDDDYDGDVDILDDDIPSGTLRMSVAAWSAGKDGVDGTYDDVKTWRE